MATLPHNAGRMISGSDSLKAEAWWGEDVLNTRYYTERIPAEQTNTAFLSKRRKPLDRTRAVVVH